MTTQEQERNRLHNKSLVEHFVRLAWNSGKFNLLKQLVTSDFVCHQNNLDGFLDIDSFIEYVKEIRFAVPDLTVTIEDLVVEGNKAFSMATFSGTFEKPALGDRKSTRLNSSHVRISYAVFCLKKKTKINKKN